MNPSPGFYAHVNQQIGMEIFKNQYVCFSPNCPFNQIQNIPTRQCHIHHPEFILAQSQINEQAHQIKKEISTNYYDNLMGILYKAVASIQEIQEIIEVFHFFPKLNEDTLDYQQRKFQKLKNSFQWVYNQEYTLLSLKNQNQQLSNVNQIIHQAKEHIEKFHSLFQSFKNDFGSQVQFLKFKKNENANNQIMQEPILPFTLAQDKHYIKIDDDSEDDNNDDDVQIVDQIDVEPDFNQLTKLKGFFDNSHNKSKYDLLSNKHVFQLSTFLASSNGNSIDILNKSQKQTQIQIQGGQDNSLEIQQQPQQKKKRRYLLKKNQIVGEENDNLISDDENKKNIYEQQQILGIVNKKISKKQKDQDYQQNQIEKQRKKRTTQAEKILELQQSLQQQQQQQHLCKQETNNKGQERQKQQQQQQQQLTVEKQNNIESKQICFEDTIINPPKIDLAIQQLDSSKTTQFTIDRSENSSSAEKIIEDDDELEEEMQVIKKQNGKLEKVLITNYSWQLNNSLEKKKSLEQNDNYSAQSLSPQQNKDQLNLTQIQNQNQQINSLNKSNYSLQQKIIYYRQRYGLLLLNQKNVILYTFKKPKEKKKNRFDEAFNSLESDDDLAVIDSKDQSNYNYNELYQKKILYGNIKSAEVFEVQCSYYVLVLFETSGLINIVKSNNFLKWKPYYKSVEPVANSTCFIFNNSTTLQILSFNSQLIKLVQLGLNCSKPKPKQIVSKFMQQSLPEGSFTTSCQGFWQIKRNSNHQVEIKNDLFFIIVQEFNVTLFKCDFQKIEQMAKDNIENLQTCKILNLCGQVSIIAILENEIQIYNGQLKMQTRIQGHPQYGNIIDCYLPSDQSLSELSIIVIQERGCFSYHCLKNKAVILNLSESYNLAFYNSHVNQLMTLNEISSSNFKINMIQHTDSLIIK